MNNHTIERSEEDGSPRRKKRWWRGHLALTHLMVTCAFLSFCVSSLGSRGYDLVGSGVVVGGEIEFVFEDRSRGLFDLVYWTDRRTVRVLPTRGPMGEILWDDAEDLARSRISGAESALEIYPWRFVLTLAAMLCIPNLLVFFLYSLRVLAKRRWQRRRVGARSSAEA